MTRIRTFLLRDEIDEDQIKRENSKGIKITIYANLFNQTSVNS